MNTFAIRRPSGELEDLLAAVPDSEPRRAPDDFLPSFDEFMSPAQDGSPKSEVMAGAAESNAAFDEPACPKPPPADLCTAAKLESESLGQAHQDLEPVGLEQAPAEHLSPSPGYDLAQMLRGIEMRVRAHAVPKALLLLDDIATLIDDPQWHVVAGERLMKILDLLPGQQVKT